MIAPPPTTIITPPPGEITSRRRTKGFEVIAWIEKHCRFTNGEWIGQPFVLLPWQRDLIKSMFEVRETGLRRYRWAYISVPKKNGKTELAAALALYFLIGDGEPSPLVVCSAASDDQADLVFGAARKMCELSPTLSLVTECFDREILVPSVPGARLLRVAAVAGTNDGKNIHAVICDELHEWTGPRGENVWNVLTNGTGARRQPMVVQITTAGFDRETVCWRQYVTAKSILDGSLEDPTYFAWVQEAPQDADYRDPAVWETANPSFGTTVHSEFFEDQLRKPEAVFRRYFLNQWTQTSQAWLPFGTWDACAQPRPVAPDEPIVLGFDGAWSNDSTALVGCTINHPYLFVLGHWYPPEGGHVDMEEIETRIRSVFATFTVRELAFDPARYQDFYARLENEGFPVVEWPTNSRVRMVPACQEFYTAVIDKALAHDGSAVLTQHIANAVVKEDRYGPRIVKESKNSMRKIDLAVAAVLAFDRAKFYATAPPEPEPFIIMGRAR